MHQDGGYADGDEKNAKDREPDFVEVLKNAKGRARDEHGAHDLAAALDRKRAVERDRALASRRYPSGGAVLAFQGELDFRPVERALGRVELFTYIRSGSAHDIVHEAEE